MSDQRRFATPEERQYLKKNYKRNDSLEDLRVKNIRKKRRKKLVVGTVRTVLNKERGIS